MQVLVIGEIGDLKEFQKKLDNSLNQINEREYQVIDIKYSNSVDTLSEYPQMIYSALIMYI